MAERRRKPPQFNPTQRHAKGCPGRNCGCSWSQRVRLPDGTHRRLTGTWDEVEKDYYDLMGRRGGPLADRTTTIAQWAAQWQAGASHWRPGTRKGMEIAVRRSINPHLGHIPVTGLRHDQVRVWVAGMRERGTGEPTIQRAVETLKTMYNVWAADGRILPHDVPIPPGLYRRPARKEFTPLTKGEVQAWKNAMPAEMRVIVELEAYYGGRESEILGLKEKHILWTGKDPNAPLAGQLERLAALPPAAYQARSPQIQFSGQLDRFTRAEAETKNARANRILPLPQRLAAELAGHFAKWPPSGGWLFVNRRPPGGVRRHPDGRPGEARTGVIEDGKPYRADGYNDHLRRAAVIAGVVLPPRQCSHALRHHCVSVLRAQNMSDHDIAVWIGDTAMTVAQVYGRPMPGSMSRIAEALEDGHSDTGAPPLRAVEGARWAPS